MFRKTLLGLSSAAILILVYMVFIPLPGCGEGSGSADTGTLQVSLTDAVQQNYSSVVITIKEVRVVQNGDENAANDDPGLPIIAQFDPPRTIDVVQLHFLQEILGTAIIPAGTYTQVRLVLEENTDESNPANYVILTGTDTKLPLTTPSGQESGVKVLGRFEVEAGVINAIMLDFDPSTAVVSTGSGSYNIKPTGIRIVQLSEVLSSYGSLSGTVTSAFKDWSSAIVSVKPQGSSSSIASGKIFSNYTSNQWQGPFSAFVPPGTYKAYVTEAKGFQPYSSGLNSVSVGQDTPLGTITLTP